MTLLRFYLSTTQPDLYGQRQPDYEVRTEGVPALVSGQRWTVVGVRYTVQDVDYAVEDGVIVVSVTLR